MNNLAEKWYIVQDKDEMKRLADEAVEFLGKLENRKKQTPERLAHVRNLENYCRASGQIT